MGEGIRQRVRVTGGVILEFHLPHSVLGKGDPDLQIWEN